MDRMLYIAMNGARQTELAQALHTNNLANASTTGFRADLAQFRSQPVFGPGYASRVYGMTERPATDFSHGPMETTGRELDVAINGDGWIAVQSGDGSEAYTRAGSLRINSLGLLETASGLPVLGNGGPVAIPPAEKVEIGSDGTITVRAQGEAPTALAVTDRIRLVKPDSAELQKGEDGLFRLKSGNPAPADASVQLVSGALEGSNVNAVDAMVNLITLARQFETQVKMMETARDNDSASAQLMRMA